MADAGISLGKPPGHSDGQRRSQTAATVTKNTTELLESKGGGGLGVLQQSIQRLTQHTVKFIRWPKLLG